MAKLVDTRNWEADYKKLKINFDRLDRMNDVLYRYWYIVNKPGGVLGSEMREARLAVEKFMEELENEHQRRRNSETPKQEG